MENIQKLIKNNNLSDFEDIVLNDEILLKKAFFEVASYGKVPFLDVYFQNEIPLNIKDENSQTPLHYACKNGNLEVLKAILKHNNGKLNLLEEKDFKGETPIHLAPFSKDIKILEYIYNINPKCHLLKNDKDESLIHSSIKANNKLAFEFLYQKFPSNIKTQLGDNYLHYAILYGDIVFIQYILENVISKLMDEKNKNGLTPFLVSGIRGDINITNWLIRSGGNVHDLDGNDYNILLIAAKYGKKDLVMWLLDNGYDIHWKNKNNYDVLCIASQFKYKEMTKSLLKRGSKVEGIHEKFIKILDESILYEYKNSFIYNTLKEDINYLNNHIKDSNLLESIMIHGNYQLFKKYFDYFEINSQTNNGRNLFHITVQYNHLIFFEILLNEITETLLFCQDKYSFNVFELCIIYGRLEFLKKIIHLVNDKSGDLLHLSIFYKQNDILNYLLKNSKQNIDKRDSKGNTALHYACSTGNTNFVLSLINNGADLYIFNDLSLKPIDLASKINHLEIVKILMNYGSSKPDITCILKEGPIQKNLFNNSFIKVKEKQLSIRNLVFQGASVKGIGYIGALDELNKNDILKDVIRIGGCSAGSIVGLIISLGYNTSDMQRVLNEINFSELLDGKWSKVILDHKSFHFNSENFFTRSKGYIDILLFLLNYAKDLFETLKIYNGLCPGEKLLDLFKNHLNLKFKDENLTFLELHKFAEKDNFKIYKDLFIVAYNLTTAREERFNYIDTPHVCIADAIRCSMAIPIIFYPHKIYKKLNGIRVCDNNDLYIDGGMFNNYPLDIFDSLNFYQDVDNKDYQNIYYYNKETLGLRIVSQSLKDYHEFGIELEKIEKTTLLKFLYDFFTPISVFAKQESDHILKKDKSRTIYIEDGGIGTLDFDLNQRKINLLKKNGAIGVKDYFARKKEFENFKFNEKLFPLLAQYITGNFEFDHGISLKNIKIKKNCPEFVYFTYKEGNDNDILLLNKLEISYKTRDELGNTCLHIAIKNGDLNTLKIIIEKTNWKGLSLIKNNNNESLLDTANSYIQSDIIRNEIINFINKNN